MTNQYEQAAETVGSTLGIPCSPEIKARFDLAITLLRAAARLPEGVDPVQVLEGHSAPPSIETLRELVERTPTNGPAPPDDAEREHCRASFNGINEYTYVPEDAEERWIEWLLRERAAADKAGYERGRAEMIALANEPTFACAKCGCCGEFLWCYDCTCRTRRSPARARGLAGGGGD